MRNLLLTLCFDGSHFHGWQVQPNAVTVQQTLCDAFERITSVRCPVTGCSRTDSGVHADMFCCNVRTETALECDRLLCALNANLPDSVAVTSCREVGREFHARYDCVSKQYRYLMWNSPIRNPFLVGYAHHIKRRLDEDKLNAAAQCFVGEHDFSAFCAAGASTVSSVRKIFDSKVIREEDRVTFFVRGNGFLYNMVRIMVGTLLEINDGKILTEQLPEIITSCDRENSGFTAPACGLYLNKVEYNDISFGNGGRM